MLTPRGNRSSGARAALAARVRDLVAELTGAAPAASLRDAPLDSLTLFAIVTRIEAAFAVSFDGDEIVALLGARAPAELSALIEAKVAEHANLDETTGNESCPEGKKAR